MPDELVAAANDDASRTTAGGSCMVTGCKQVVADGSTNPRTAYTLQRCSTCGGRGWPSPGCTKGEINTKGNLQAVRPGDTSPSLCDDFLQGVCSATCRSDGVWIGDDAHIPFTAIVPVCVGIACEAGVIPHALNYTVASKTPLAYPTVYPPSFETDLDGTAFPFCHGGYGDVCEYTCSPGYNAVGVHTCAFETPSSQQPVWHGGACLQ
jgi:hypothetical protein